MKRKKQHTPITIPLPHMSPERLAEREQRLAALREWADRWTRKDRKHENTHTESNDDD